MKYAYIEITENCNLACPFCPSRSLKSRGEMPVELFEKILERLSGNVNEIFLHVLGEPLLHSRFPQILDAAERFGFPVNLTTNGTLIEKYAQTLLQTTSVRQINFSTHAYAYLSEEAARKALDGTIRFVQRLCEVRPQVYVNFRLWNARSDARSEAWNDTVLRALSESFRTEIRLPKFSARHKSLPVAGRVYLHRDSRFAWPTGEGELSERGTCHGIIDQCAVLVNGTVVPCCLDCTGKIPLGKFPEDSFDKIFQGEKSRKIADGFRSHKLIDPFCRQCTFARRFP